MRRAQVTALIMGLALAAMAAILVYIYLRPVTLRIAVVRGSVDHALVQEVARIFQADRAPVRLIISPVSDASAAVKAMDSGIADLIISPSDQPLPTHGKTVAIMRRNIVLLIAPAGSKIAGIGDLKGKSLGIIRDEASNNSHNRILDALLSRFDMPADAAGRRQIELAEATEQLKSGQLDAIFVTGVAGDGPVSDAVQAVAAASGGEPVFVPVGHISALVQQSSAFETFTLSAGTFAGAQSRPPQEMETLAYTVRLFASSNLRDMTAGALTRALFGIKPRLSAANPAALRIQAPPTSKDIALPAHPGTAAFLDGEEENFFDRFSEFFYLGAMVLSIVGSAIAAIATHLGSDSKREYRAMISRLLEILRLARLADDNHVLRLLQLETDNIFAEFMAAASTGRHDEERVSHLGLVAAQVHQALLDRRTALGEAASGPSGSQDWRQIS